MTKHVIWLNFDSDPNIFVERGMLFKIGTEKAHHEDDQGYYSVRRRIPAGTVLLALEDHYTNCYYVEDEVMINPYNHRGKVLTPYGVGWVLYNASNKMILEDGEKDGNSEKR